MARLPPGFQQGETDACLPMMGSWGHTFYYRSCSVQQACKQHVVLPVINTLPYIKIWKLPHESFLPTQSPPCYSLNDFKLYVIIKLRFSDKHCFSSKSPGILAWHEPQSGKICPHWFLHLRLSKAMCLFGVISQIAVLRNWINQGYSTSFLASTYLKPLSLV